MVEADRCMPPLVPSHGHVADGTHEAMDVNERISKRKQKKGEITLRPSNAFVLLSFTEILDSNGEEGSYLAV